MLARFGEQRRRAGESICVHWGTLGGKQRRFGRGFHFSHRYQHFHKGVENKGRGIGVGEALGGGQGVVADSLGAVEMMHISPNGERCRFLWGRGEHLPGFVVFADFAQGKGIARGVLFILGQKAKRFFPPFQRRGKIVALGGEFGFLR